MNQEQKHKIIVEAQALVDYLMDDNKDMSVNDAVIAVCDLLQTALPDEETPS